MQLKLGAGVLTVALLYAVVGSVVPLLGLPPVLAVVLTISSYGFVGLGAAWWLGRRVAGRLRRLSRAAAEIGAGDLTSVLDVGGDDEVADLARSLALIRDNLRRLVLEVRESVERVDSSAHTLSATSQELHTRTGSLAVAARDVARGFEEQASAVLATSDTTRDLSLSVERVSARARDVFQSASAAAERAARGADDARRATQGIGQLARSTGAAAAAIEGFRRKAGEIGPIVDSIASISHQTHLLAINAAIEAARAGTEGRGFAVVAEEVGRLADDVRGFAEQISSISEQIMLGSHSAADEFRRSVTAAEELREAVDRSVASFDGILGAIRGTASRVGEISQLTSEQKEAAAEVARSLERMSRLAEDNARGTGASSAATHEQAVAMQRMVDSTRRLAGGSDQLRSVVAVFKVR